MRRGLWAGLAGLVAVAAPAIALVAIMPVPNMQQRVAQVDAAVAGKVTSIEDKVVKTERYPGDKEGGEYRIAVVKVSDTFFGTQGLTHVKVGFVPAPPAPPVIQPDDQPVRPIRPIRPIRPGFQPPTLAAGQEAVLLLRQHHKENFYVMQSSYDVIDRKSGDYSQQVDELKKLSKLLADPMAALKSKDTAERFQAASLLVARYKSARPGQQKQEAIPAEESKLILEAIADADWTPKVVRPGTRFDMNPQQLFYQLGIQPKDGWMQPANFQEVPAAAKKWLKENSGKFKVTRFVAGMPDK